MNIKTPMRLTRYFCVISSLMFVVAVISCKLNVVTTTERSTITFSIDGENGTLTAKTVDGTNVNTGNSVEKGKFNDI